MNAVRAAEIEWVRRVPTVEEYRDFIERAGWSATTPLEEAARALPRSLAAWVATIDGDVVAIGRAVGDGIYISLHDLIVHPDHRGRGIGSALLARLIEDLRAEFPASTLALFAAHGTQGFYEKHGFRRRPDDAPGMMRGPDRSVSSP